jgi:hypothetical protein
LGPAGFIARTLSHVLVMASVQICFPTGRPADSVWESQRIDARVPAGQVEGR